jgi:ABC-2 type transport system permease protein
LIATFSAFAFWTAAWTRSAESAQLTSLPLILLASVGPMVNTVPDLPGWLKDLLALTPGAAMSDLIRVGWFGLDGPDATETTLSFAQTWGQAFGPLLVLAAWLVLAITLARRSIRWEPRT